MPENNCPAAAQRDILLLEVRTVVGPYLLTFP
jgi:hypothetical protein